MIAVIQNRIGRVYHAVGHPSLKKIRPVYCWVPEEFLGENGLDKSRYLASRWPSINCSANPLAVGSHVIPDTLRPVNLQTRCPILTKFLLELEAIAAVKTIFIE
jgi:hypothetical protein